jgi:hypothetical protein
LSRPIPPIAFAIANSHITEKCQPPVGYDFVPANGLQNKIVFEELSLEFRDDHIYIHQAEDFEITSEAMSGFWDLLSRQCERYECANILIEADSPKRNIDTVGAFTSGVHVSNIAPNLWLALCLHNYEPDEISELFRDAAGNRGANVEFFSDPEKALNWLRVNNPQF